MAVPGQAPRTSGSFSRISDKPQNFERRNNWYASPENKIGNATIVLNIKDLVDLYSNPKTG
jgi:hypothetical protein